MYSLQQKEISNQNRTNSKKVSGESKNIIIQQKESEISTKIQYQNNNYGKEYQQNEKQINNNNNNYNKSMNQNKNIIITSKEKTYTNSNQINGNNNFINLNQSGLSKDQKYYSSESKLNNNTNMKQKYFYTIKKNPLNVTIEYENNKYNNGIIHEENGNFNVYFMKPDFRTKTFTTIKKTRNNNYVNGQIYKQNKIENKKQLTYEDDNDNPYNDNNYNFQNQEPQFQQKDWEIMPLEIIHYNNEKKFKLNLIQKLKSFKMNQAENKNVPLNIAAKKRREENLENKSMKYLLAKLSQPIDFKKELMYYKGYFRFWKRKTKKSFDPIFKRKIKKDRNIRITYMIYKADIPKKVKNVEKQLIIEKQQNENDIFRQHLILNLEKKNKEKLKASSNYNIIHNIYNEMNINKENVNSKNENVNYKYENIIINNNEQNEKNEQNEQNEQMSNLSSDLKILMSLKKYYQKIELIRLLKIFLVNI